MPSKERHHNPPMDPEVHDKLMDLKWRRRCTWRELYAWAVPVLLEADRSPAPK